jgi:hypothetical protein
VPALQFEWDEVKASANAEKHGVTFQEASSVFLDPLARVLPDPTDPSGEDRAIMIGHSIRANCCWSCLPTVATVSG